MSSKASSSTLLLSNITWHLSYLGHRFIDIVRFSLSPNSLLRKLPILRIAVVASMSILILQQNLDFTIHIGAPANTAQKSPTVDNRAYKMEVAGFFSSSSIEAATNRLEDDTAISLITRFRGLSELEAEKFNLDNGVLLAGAILASTDPNTSSTNIFGSALTGRYATAWESWRAMSLSLVSNRNSSISNQRTSNVKAMTKLFHMIPDAEKQLEFIMQRYSL